MSIWYHLDVTAISADKAAVAKFFHLRDSWEDVRTEMFEFSFGGRNAPGLTLHKIMEQNPDLIFLIKQEIEVDTEQWFLMRFDAATGTQQSVFIQDSGEWNNEINKKISEDFAKENPSLPADHWLYKRGNEKHRWKGFFGDFNKSATILSQASQYKEMLPHHFEVDLEFDNTPLVGE